MEWKRITDKMIKMAMSGDWKNCGLPNRGVTVLIAYQTYKIEYSLAYIGNEPIWKNGIGWTYGGYVWLNPTLDERVCDLDEAKYFLEYSEPYTDEDIEEIEM